MPTSKLANQSMIARITVITMTATLLCLLAMLSTVQPHMFAAPILPTSTPLPCITFDSVPVGATYVPGRVYSTGGAADLAVTSISGGGWPWLDLLTVVAANNPHQVNEGLLNDARVHFYPARATTIQARIYVRQLDGNVTLTVNGKTRSAATFGKLHGELLDTAEISVQPLRVPGELLTLRGALQSFAVGGDALAIDNICLDG